LQLGRHAGLPELQMAIEAVRREIRKTCDDIAAQKSRIICERLI
jgi:hypothetical protein